MARKLQARTRITQAVCFKGELKGFTNVRPTCIIVISIIVIIIVLNLMITITSPSNWASLLLASQTMVAGITY